jgi:tetratricopeptide (TPR) repeat protein
VRDRAGVSRIVRLLAWVAWGAVLCTGGLVRAQEGGAPDADATVSPTPSSDAAIVEARTHYDQGVVFFRAERFEEAIAEFEEAYALWQNPTILYSLGQANERLLRVPAAIAHYRRFLDTTAQDDARRTEVEDTIRGLSALLCTVHVQVNVPATAYADGEELGPVPGDLVLATGRPELEIRAEGYVTHHERLTLAARTERTLTVELAPEVVVAHDDRLDPTAFWTTFSITAASGVAWAVLGGFLFDAASRYQSAAVHTAAARDDGQRLAVATDVVGGVTLALAASTVILGLLTRFDAPVEARPVALRLAPGGLALEF